MNKKLLYLLVIVLLLASCNASIKMLDGEGWEIFQCGWSLNENDILIQSHDGYVLDGRFYTEHIDTIEPIIEEDELIIYEGKSVLIENRIDNPINVKLTYNSVIKWIEINANDSYLVGVACFQ
jgi:hypothetical protein